MKSPEVYSLLKSELAPYFKSNDFKRVKGFLGWSRLHGDAHSVIWFQVSRDGWDVYAGSRFVVEFQRSPEPLIGSVVTNRQRIAKFLSSSEREEVRSIQNSIIAKLKRPPASHPFLHIAREVTDSYLLQFKTVTEPYPEGSDIWLRYASPEHITRWAHFVLDKLPKCIAVAEAWPNIS